MSTISRRKLFGLMANTALLVAVTGCATTQTGTTTTATINVAKISAYISAGMNGATTVLSVISQFPTIAGYSERIQTIITSLQDINDQWANATHGELSVAYDNASTRTIILSMFTMLEQLASLIKTIVTSMLTVSVPGSSVNKIQFIYNSLATLVSVLKAVLYPVFAHVDMNQYNPVETKALQTLNA